MENMDRITQKVQNLLNLAGNNPEQKEAEAALLKAQALIARYNLDMEKYSGGMPDFRHDLFLSKVRVGGIKNRLAQIIANAFACKLLLAYDAKNIQRTGFFGREDNAKAAVEAMNFAYKVMNKGDNKAVKEYGYKPGEYGSSCFYNSYAIGFVCGLKDCMDEQTKALAIVITEDVKAAYSERYEGKTGTYKSRKTKAYGQGAFDSGYTAGKSCMNRRAVCA